MYAAGLREAKVIKTATLTILMGAIAWAQPAIAQSLCGTGRAGVIAIWDGYVTALRRGDLDELRVLFHPDGTFHVAQPETTKAAGALRAQRFAEALPTWTASPDPTADGKVRHVALYGGMAVLEGRLRFGGRLYDDVLTLYCLDGRWRVVGKTTNVREH
jgi:hypothetical protein